MRYTNWDRLEDLLLHTELPDKCMEWEWGKATSGYGTVQNKETKKATTVHRAAFQIYYEIDLLTKDFICHRCDNRLCFNPKHLFKGTSKINAQDMAQKDRSTYGERSATAKLTEKDVYNILSLRGTLPSNTVGEMYQIHGRHIRAIWSGKWWNRQYNLYCREHPEFIKLKSKRTQKPIPGVYCPFCASAKIRKEGRYKEMQKYQCKECLKSFRKLI